MQRCYNFLYRTFFERKDSNITNLQSQFIGYKMKKFLYIKSNFKNISSVLLLFVFTLSITPKKTLHAWFANHKDSSTIPYGKTQQLTKAGFNCNCDDFVAESHFISVGSFVIINIRVLRSFISLRNPSFISLSSFLFNLRGPPLKF